MGVAVWVKMARIGLCLPHTQIHDDVQPSASASSAAGAAAASLRFRSRWPIASHRGLRGQPRGSASFGELSGPDLFLLARSQKGSGEISRPGEIIPGGGGGYLASQALTTDALEPTPVQVAGQTSPAAAEAELQMGARSRASPPPA